MSSKENQPLDFDKTYPCPSCRQGSLVPITLTEAWGCDYCKQIFEKKAESEAVQKLGTPHHRQHTWKWNGQQWVVSSKLVRPKTANTALIVLLGGILWFGITQITAHITLSGLLWVSIIVLILLAMVVLFWVVLRR